MFIHAILDLSKQDWLESAKDGGQGVWLSGIEMTQPDVATTKEAFADFLAHEMVPPCTIHWQNTIAWESDSTGGHSCLNWFIYVSANSCQ